MSRMPASVVGLFFAAGLLISGTADARYFLAQEGRWLQPDRMGMIDGPNKYQYARSNPVTQVDPLGRFGVSIDPSASRHFGFSVHQQATLAATAAIDFEYRSEDIPFYFNENRGGRIYEASNTVNWRGIRFVPVVRLELSCQPANKFGQTPRSYSGFLPVIRVNINAFETPDLGPNTLAATIFHEWIHASINAFIDRSPNPDVANTVFRETETWGPLYPIRDNLSEVIAHHAERVMFPNAGIRLK